MGRVSGCRPLRLLQIIKKDALEFIEEIKYAEGKILEMLDRYKSAAEIALILACTAQALARGMRIARTR